MLICIRPVDIRRALGEIVDGRDSEFGDIFIDMLRDMREKRAELDNRIASYNRRFKNLFRSNEMCQRIGQIESAGPIAATASVASIGDKSCFKNSRQFAAWLGLVPKQHSSGGKARLLGLSKPGDRYLRTLLIHGGRAVNG